MLSSQIKSNEIVFGSCNKDLLEEIIFYGIGLGADFVEIFIENTDNSSVLAEEDFITSVSPSFGRGAGIRIFKGKKDGFVSTNDLTKHGLMRSVSKTFKKLPKYLSNGYQLLRLYLIKPLDSKDFQPSIR